MPIDIMSMKLPSKKKVEVEMEPMEEMGDMPSEDMGPEEEMPLEGASADFAKFSDDEILNEAKARGLI